MNFALKKNKKINNNSRKIKISFRKSNFKDKVRLQIMIFSKINKEINLIFKLIKKVNIIVISQCLIKINVDTKKLNTKNKAKILNK